MKRDDLQTWAILGAAAAVAYAVWRAARAAHQGAEWAGEQLDDAQQAGTDLFADLSGLAAYERALMAAKTPAEIRALRQAWESRPFWQRW